MMKVRQSFLFLLFVVVFHVPELGAQTLDALTSTLDSTPPHEQRYRTTLSSLVELIHREKKRELLPYAAEKFKAIPQNDQPMETGLLAIRLGDLLFDHRYFTECIEVMYAALFHFEKTDAVPYQFNVHSYLSLSYSRLGNNRKAIELAEKSLNIKSERIPKDSYLDVISNLGIMYRRMNNYPKAIYYYTQVYEAYKNTPEHQNFTDVLSNMAALYINLGDYDQALPLLLESAKWAKPEARTYTYPYTHLMLSNAYAHFNELDKANHHAELLLRYAKAQNAIEDMADAYRSFGNIEAKRGNAAKADEWYTQMLELAHQLESVFTRTTYLNLYISFLMDQKQFVQALEIAEAAFEALQGMETLSVYHTTAGLYAQALRMNGQAKAFELANTTIATLEKERANMGLNTQTKAWYLSGKTQMYRLAAQWHIAQGTSTGLERGFELLEQSKSRSFSDDLAASALVLDDQVPDQLKERRDQTYADLQRSYSQQRTAKDARSKDSLMRISIELERTYQAVMEELSEVVRNYSTFRFPKPITLKQAQQLYPADVAILTYSVTRDTLTIVALSQRSAKAVQLAVTQEMLQRHVQEFREAITSEAPLRVVHEKGRQLSEWLTAPLSALQGVTKLIVIPDDVLSFVPFEALRVHETYLIERYAIKYAPSVTTLPFFKPSGITETNLLAVGHPVFKPEQDVLTPLPFSKVEVDSIRQYVHTSTVFFADQATERNLLMAQNKPYRFMHFATHGLIDEQNPALSGLAFSHNEDDRQRYSGWDGFLSGAEIYGLKLTTDLVVLSACNTALGKNMSGEGLLGLQRAFLFAGASSVMVSQWSVFDRSTATFMNRFYRNLVLQEREYNSTFSSVSRWFDAGSLRFGYKAEALRQAKRSMINSKASYAHPVHWAAFILMGD